MTATEKQKARDHVELLIWALTPSPLAPIPLASLAEAQELFNHLSLDPEDREGLPTASPLDLLLLNCKHRQR